jgi:hypothetical protein
MAQAVADYKAAKEQQALWADDGAARIASHAAVSGLGAAMGGGNVAGAVGGTIAGDYVGNAVGHALGDSMGGNVMANAAAGVAGAAAGGVLGGSAGAMGGAGGALNADLYNRQLHPDEKKAIHDAAHGDKAEEEKLTRAACYAVKCWAEYAPGSDQRNANFVSEVEASQLGPELAWVSNQKEAGLFDYTPGQKFGDMMRSDPFGVVKDAAKLVTGGLTIKTGAGLCATSGVGCALGGAGMIAFGASDMAEGADGLYNRYNGINSPGTNPLRWGFNQVLPAGWGNVAYDGANLIFAIGALTAPTPLKMGTADGLNRPGSMFDVTVSNFNNNKLIPFTGQAAPYGVNQGILLFGVGSKGAAVINDIRSSGGQK